MQTVDARGLACPQPVILTRRAMREGRPLCTVVDNEVALANVSRMAAAAGWSVEVQRLEDGTRITLRPADQDVVPEAVAEPEAPAAAGPTVLLLASDGVGQGDATLGQLLMRSLLHTLQEVEQRPDVVICLNHGVRLAVSGSPVLEDLQMLERSGVSLLICGTCLDYLHLKDSLAVGTISNMYTIAETLLGAGRVVRL